MQSPSPRPAAPRPPVNRDPPALQKWRKASRVAVAHSKYAVATIEEFLSLGGATPLLRAMQAGHALVVACMLGPPHPMLVPQRHTGPDAIRGLRANVARLESELQELRSSSKLQRYTQLQAQLQARTTYQHSVFTAPASTHNLPAMSTAGHGQH